MGVSTYMYMYMLCTCMTMTQVHVHNEYIRTCTCICIEFLSQCVCVRVCVCVAAGSGHERSTEHRSRPSEYLPSTQLLPHHHRDGCCLRLVWLSGGAGQVADQVRYWVDQVRYWADQVRYWVYTCTYIHVHMHISGWLGLDNGLASLEIWLTSFKIVWLTNLDG